MNTITAHEIITSLQETGRWEVQYTKPDILGTSDWYQNRLKYLQDKSIFESIMTFWMYQALSDAWFDIMLDHSDEPEYTKTFIMNDFHDKNKYTLTFYCAMPYHPIDKKYKDSIQNAIIGMHKIIRELYQEIMLPLYQDAYIKLFDIQEVKKVGDVLFYYPKDYLESVGFDDVYEDVMGKGFTNQLACQYINPLYHQDYIIIVEVLKNIVENIHPEEPWNEKLWKILLAIIPDKFIQVAKNDKEVYYYEPLFFNCNHIPFNEKNKNIFVAQVDDFYGGQIFNSLVAICLAKNEREKSFEMSCLVEYLTVYLEVE